MVMLMTTKNNSYENSARGGTYNNDNNKRFHKYKETMTKISSLSFCAFTTTHMPYSLQGIKKKKKSKQICNYALHFFLVQKTLLHLMVRFLCYRTGGKRKQSKRFMTLTNYVCYAVNTLIPTTSSIVACSHLVSFFVFNFILLS